MHQYYRYPLAMECVPFLLGGGGLLALGAFFHLRWMVFVSLIFTGFVLFFFRNPERSSQEADNRILSPADGKIARIEEDIRIPEVFGDSSVTRVAVFMSVFNVHVNRMPVAGTADRFMEKGDQYLNAMDDDASIKNRAKEMILDTAHGKMMVRQVAGMIARQIVNRLREGDSLPRGEAFGMIRFGSRVEICFPTETARVLVKTGDRVYAGRTPIGEYGR